MNKVLKQSIINGRMEIVGILLARIYLQRLKNYRVVIHIHNLCIILILSFLLGILVSQRRIKCAFKNCGEQNFLQGRARGPPPPPPGRGVCGCRVNQSCLTADMWFHSVIRYLPGQKDQSTATGWRKKVARKVNVYTRHIRHTKGQRSGHGVYTSSRGKRARLRACR